MTFLHASVMIAMFSQDITDVCGGQEVGGKKAKLTVNTCKHCTDIGSVLAVFPSGSYTKHVYLKEVKTTTLSTEGGAAS